MTAHYSRTRPLNILLIEDDDGDAMSVERAFAKARVANPITRAYDGLDALELLRSEDRRGLCSPFIILLDVNMPRMNGHEFLKELRSDPDLRHLVVFMLSTSRHDQDIKAAYSQHVAGYIVKQTAGEDFLNMASTFDAYWKMVELAHG
ncbi:two-component system response regulator [Jannaschia sp. EhC01]|nr:two-component system response regulator [Jannaschia sp. EhC01]